MAPLEYRCCILQKASAAEQSFYSGVLNRGLNMKSVAMSSGVRVVLWSFAFHSLLAQPLSPKRVVLEYPRNGVVLGNGWDLQAMDKASHVCVDFTETKDMGQDKDMVMTAVSDKFALMREFNVDTEFSFKFVTAQLTDKTRYVNKLELKEEYVNLALRAYVKNGARHASPVNGRIRLKPEYLAMARKDVTTFIRTCGTSFVSSMFGGAELISVLTFKVVSLEEQKSIRDSFEGSGWGVVINSTSDSKMRKYVADDTLRITFHQSGGSGEPIPTSKEELLASLARLAAGAAADPKTFEIEVTSYDSLPDWPAQKPLLRQKNHGMIASQYCKLQSLYFEVQSMLERPEHYILDRGVDLAGLKKIEIDLKAHLMGLSTTALKCAAGDCVINPSDTIEDYVYRKWMPAARGSFEEDVELDKAISDLAAKRKGLASQLAMAQTSPSSLNRDLNRVAASRTTVAVQDAEALVKALQARYPAALKRAIVEKWISVPSRQRCKADINDPACLNSKQIDQLAAFVKIHRLNRYNFENYQKNRMN